MRTPLVIGAALVGVLAASYVTRRAADAASQASETGETALDYFNPWGAIARTVDQHQVDQTMSEKNVDAFLDAIMWAEGTAGQADPYRVCYRYRHTIRDLSDHPAVTGEWKGEPLDSLGPRYKGLKSTAAGALQIIKPTWLEVKRALSLPDFGPESQRRAGVWLIKRRGALEDVLAGNLQAAVDKCAAEWASLPGSTSGQPQRKFAALADVYEQQGGQQA